MIFDDDTFSDNRPLSGDDAIERKLLTVGVTDSNFVVLTLLAFVEVMDLVGV